MIEEVGDVIYDRTSDGRYNDTSGIAYLLLYDSEERIKTFYTGGFQDGYFRDQSGNAIELVHDGYKYFCYKGTFTNKKRDKDVSGKDYVDQEEIQKIIQDTIINFGIELDYGLINFRKELPVVLGGGECFSE